MSKSTDERLNKLLALGGRLEGEERRKIEALDRAKLERADRKHWVEQQWTKTFHPAIESAIEVLNQKLHMVEMPRMLLKQPSPGTSAKVEILLESDVSGRCIKSDVSLTDNHIQFQHYRRSATQLISIGHNTISFDSFDIDSLNVVFADILEAFTTNHPK